LDRRPARFALASRLAILTALSACEKADFVFLLNVTRLIPRGARTWCPVKT
jgi:hypothetical protein